MATVEAPNPLLGETTCSSLLQQLQEIWDEVGENDEERDKMLLQLEQECLDVYKRKVDVAAKSRAQLLQTLADAKFEFTNLRSAFGEKSFIGISVKCSRTIRQQFASLEKLWKQKENRIREFIDVQVQISNIIGELLGTNEQVKRPLVDEADPSLKKLESQRLGKVVELLVTNVHDLCAVLGMELNDSSDVQSKSISNDTLVRLAKTVLNLKEDNMQMLHKLQVLATQLTDLWNLMDTLVLNLQCSQLQEITTQLTDLWNLMETPEEERNLFDHAALAWDLIEQAEGEVERRDQVRSSKMKEIAFKRLAELEEIFACSHIEFDSEAAREKILELIDSGNVEPTSLLVDRILKAKEEAVGRKDIVDKVEKWMSACEEKSRLEDDYDMDGSINLERGNKLLGLDDEISDLVYTLEAEYQAWEKEHGLSFVYDGYTLRALLDTYILEYLTPDKEEERELRKICQAQKCFD